MPRTAINAASSRRARRSLGRRGDAGRPLSVAAGSASDAVLRVRDSSTTLVDFTLADPAFDTAPATSTGVITLQSTPISATGSAGGDAGGDADKFTTLDKDGTQVLAGSVAATGMGGDIEVSNVSIANSQDCSLTSFTYTSAT